MIHLRLVSPPDVTSAVMPMLHAEPAVMNVTMLPGTASHPGAADYPRRRLRKA